MGTSPNSSLGAVCRICHCGETSIPYLGATGGEPLISPCHCKGTMGLYHRSCVQHWLTLSGTACCEICNFCFQLKKKNRSFWDFFKANACMKGEDGRGTMTDLMCFTVLTPFALGSSYLCIHAGVTCTEESGSHEGEWNAPEGLAMLTMAAFLLMIYFTWLFVTVAFYRSEFQSWRKNNQVIYVVDQLSADESLQFNGNRRCLPIQWIIKSASFFRDLIRRRNGADVSAIYIPESVMENADRSAGSAESNRSVFTISPMDSFYAAGHNVEYPPNVYAESSPLLGAGDDESSTLMLTLLTVPAGSRTSISPIAVCSPRAPSCSSAVPRPPVPKRHSSLSSAVSSFSCSPASESGANSVANNGFLTANSHWLSGAILDNWPPGCSPDTANLPRRALTARTLTPICVTAASGSLQPPKHTGLRTPLSATLSTISNISAGGFYSAPPAAATAQQHHTHGSMMRSRPLHTSTPSSNRVGSSAIRSSRASALTPDRLETQV